MARAVVLLLDGEGPADLLRVDIFKSACLVFLFLVLLHVVLPISSVSFRLGGVLRLRTLSIEALKLYQISR